MLNISSEIARDYLDRLNQGFFRNKDGNVVAFMQGASRGTIPPIPEIAPVLNIFVILPPPNVAFVSELFQVLLMSILNLGCWVNRILEFTKFLIAIIFV